MSPFNRRSGDTLVPSGVGPAINSRAATRLEPATLRPPSPSSALPGHNNRLEQMTWGTPKQLKGVSPAVRDASRTQAGGTSEGVMQLGSFVGVTAVLEGDRTLSRRISY